MNPEHRAEVVYYREAGVFPAPAPHFYPGLTALAWAVIGCGLGLIISTVWNEIKGEIK